MIHTDSVAITTIFTCMIVVVVIIVLLLSLTFGVSLACVFPVVLYTVSASLPMWEMSHREAWEHRALVL